MSLPDCTEGTVLVVGDDLELSGLIALNLRQRGFRVEHTDPSLALSSRWEPAFGPPDYLIVDIESGDRIGPAQLSNLLDRPWAVGAPVILAADSPEPFARALRHPPHLVLDQPGDVAAIVNAVRSLQGSAPV
jgi:DNA-binding response OmpR family regulator